MPEKGTRDCRAAKVIAVKLEKKEDIDPTERDGFILHLEECEPCRKKFGHLLEAINIGEGIS